MFYTIYKTTNKANGKYYIGKHQTQDLNDNYLGSGTLLKRAIRKYGKDSFIKEILFVFETEAEMNAKEKELVVVSEETYNLCDGGNGGFGYINKNILIDHRALSQKGNLVFLEKMKQPLFRTEQSEKISNVIKEKYKNGWNNKPSSSHIEKWWKAAQTPEVNRKRSDTLKAKNLNGCNNPSYGKMWINDGYIRKFVDKGESIPEGWSIGFKLKDT